MIEFTATKLRNEPTEVVHEYFTDAEDGLVYRKGTARNAHEQNYTERDMQIIQIGVNKEYTRHCLSGIRLEMAQDYAIRYKQSLVVIDEPETFKDIEYNGHECAVGDQGTVKLKRKGKGNAPLVLERYTCLRNIQKVKLPDDNGNFIGIEIGVLMALAYSPKPEANQNFVVYNDMDKTNLVPSNISWSAFDSLHHA